MKATSASTKRSSGGISSTVSALPISNASRSEDKIIFSKAVALLVASKQRKPSAAIAAAYSNSSSDIQQSLSQHHSHYVPLSSVTAAANITTSQISQYLSTSVQPEELYHHHSLSQPSSSQLSIHKNQLKKLLHQSANGSYSQDTATISVVSNTNAANLAGNSKSLNNSQPQQQPSSPISQSRASLQQSKLNQLLLGGARPSTISSSQLHRQPPIRNNLVTNSVVDSSIDSSFLYNNPAQAFHHSAVTALNSSFQTSKALNSGGGMSVALPPQQIPTSAKLHLQKHNTLNLQQQQQQQLATQQPVKNIHQQQQQQQQQQSVSHMQTNVSPQRKTRQTIEDKSRQVFTEGNANSTLEGGLSSSSSQHLTFNISPDTIVLDSSKERLLSGQNTAPRGSQRSFVESSRFLASQSAIPTVVAQSIMKPKQQPSLQLSQFLSNSVQPPPTPFSGSTYPRNSGAFTTVSPSTLSKGRNTTNQNRSQLSLSYNPLTIHSNAYLGGSEQSGRSKQKASPSNSIQSQLLRTPTPQHHSLSLQIDSNATAAATSAAAEKSSLNSVTKHSSSSVSVGLSSLSSILMPQHQQSQQQQHQKNSKSLVVSKNSIPTHLNSSQSPPQGTNRHTDLVFTTKNSTPFPLSSAASLNAAAETVGLYSHSKQQQRNNIHSTSSSKSPPRSDGTQKTACNNMKKTGSGGVGSGLSNRYVSQQPTGMTMNESRLSLHRQSVNNLQSTRTASRHRSQEQGENEASATVIPGGVGLPLRLLEDFKKSAIYDDSKPWQYFEQFLQRLTDLLEQVQQMESLVGNGQSGYRNGSNDQKGTQSYQTSTTRQSSQFIQTLHRILDAPLRSLISKTQQAMTNADNSSILKQTERELQQEKKERQLLEVKLQALEYDRFSQQQERLTVNDYTLCNSLQQHLTPQEIQAIFTENQTLHEVVKKQKKQIVASNERASRTAQIIAELKTMHNISVNLDEHYRTSFAHSVQSSISTPAVVELEPIIKADQPQRQPLGFDVMGTNANSYNQSNFLSDNLYEYQNYVPRTLNNGNIEVGRKLPVATKFDNGIMVAEEMLVERRLDGRMTVNKSIKDFEEVEVNQLFGKKHDGFERQQKADELISDNESDVLSIGSNRNAAVKDSSSIKSMNEGLRGKLKINLGNIHVVEGTGNSKDTSGGGRGINNYQAVNNGQNITQEVFGYHDEFMNRFDEFSQSWRAAIIAERRYQE